MIALLLACTAPLMPSPASRARIDTGDTADTGNPCPGSITLGSTTSHVALKPGDAVVTAPLTASTDSQVCALSCSSTLIRAAITPGDCPSSTTAPDDYSMTISSSAVLCITATRPTRPSMTATPAHTCTLTHGGGTDTVSFRYP